MTAFGSGPAEFSWRPIQKGTVWLCVWDFHLENVTELQLRGCCFFLVVSMTSSCSWEDAAAAAGRPFLSCQHGWKLASLKCWLLDSWSKALQVFPNVVTHVIDNSYQFVYHQDMNYMIVFCVWSGNEGNVLSRHKPYDMFRFQIFW